MPKIFRVFCLLPAFVLFTVPVSAQTGATGVIRGAITDAVSGAPLSGAHVEFFDTSARFVDGVFISGSTYERTLLAGRYFLRIRINDPAHFTMLFGGHPCVADDCSVLAGTPIDVAAGATVTADIAAPRAGAIAGAVRSVHNAAPLPAYVELYNAAGSAMRSLTMTHTADDGTFLLRSLPPGTYFARARTTSSEPRAEGQLFSGISCPALGRCPIVRGTPITVTTDQTTTGIDFALTPIPPAPGSGSIGGRVAIASGIAAVFAYRSGHRFGPTYSGFVNHLGIYRIMGLPDGVYDVEASASEYVPQIRTVTVVGGSAVEGIDFELSVGGTIEGMVMRVLPDPLPPYPIYPGFTQVHVYDSAGVQRGINASPRAPNTYRIVGLPAGRYFVVAKSRAELPSLRSPGGGDMIGEIFHDIPCVSFDCDPLRGTPVTVSLGSTTTVDVSLEFGGSIVGRRPEGTIAEVYDAFGRLLTERVRNNPAFNFPDRGAYEAVGLPSGYYYLRLKWPGGSVIYPDIRCDACPVTDGTKIFVRAGERTIVDFNVDVGFRSISGTVRDASTGLPLSTIAVQLFGVSGESNQMVLTDELGLFRFTARRGTYYARTQNTRGYIDERFDDITCGACGIAGSRPIVVDAADVSGIDFQLTPGVIVRGEITSDTLAVSEVRVALVDSSGAAIDRPTSDATGTFLTAVPPGTYFARTEPKPRFKSELYQERACPHGTCDPRSGDPIAASTDRSGVNFTLDTCSVSLSPTSTLANAIAGFPYRLTLAASGGTGPYRYTVASGTLPAGLSLDATTGLVSGTPASATSATAMISAIDAAGCATARTYTIAVEACSSSVQFDTFIATPAQQPIDRGRDWIAVPASGGTVTGHFTGTCSYAAMIATAASSVSWLRVREVIPPAGSAADDVAIDIDPNPSATLFRTGHVFLNGDAIQVRQAPLTTAAPFGVVDTPADGAAVSGSIAVTGWVLDDLGTSRVHIYRDPVSPEAAGLVYIGDAVFVRGARPDVELIYGTFPNANRAGWGYLLLTNMLPNRGTGEYRLYAFADDAEGHSVLLGTRRIVADNAGSPLPFGAIDTPAQGETVRGTLVNFGWALTPQPKMIPIDGATIHVFIDGVPIGTVDYDHPRADIATLFPGFANSNGPIGFRMLDTTTLADGMHTISWAVTDNLGAAAGIGSRFFTVDNQGASAPLGADAGRQAMLLDDARVSTVRVSAWRDADPGAGALRSDEEGVRHLKMRSLDRIELGLSPAVASECRATYVGYEVVRGELRTLPAGASLDPAGVFYWHPGPAFLGVYELLFVRTDCMGARERIPVRVTVTNR